MKKLLVLIFSLLLFESCSKKGCTDPLATNYNSDAITDDGSCIIEGCTDATAVNYNPDATVDNGTCQFLATINTVPVLYDGQSRYIESGGIISSDGGSEVTLRGVCWSTNTNPTILDDTTINGSGTGNFTSLVDNLDYKTTYYIRAYATNSFGTTYGEEYHFTTANFTLIPDQYFEQVLIALGCDDIIDGKVGTQNIDTLSNLHLATNLLITDLTGLEDFISLYYLNCLGCLNLTTINLTQNHLLNYLDFSETQISSIDLTQNTALTTLRCFNNPQLNSLDLSNNTQLNSLECSSTSITSLDLTMNSNLTTCFCFGSQLSCVNLKNGNNQIISALVFSNNPNLSCIEVDNPTWSTQNWIGPSWIFGFNSGTTFSSNCNYPAGCF